MAVSTAFPFTPSIPLSFRHRLTLPALWESGQHSEGAAGVSCLAGFDGDGWKGWSDEDALELLTLKFPVKTT